MPQGEALLPSAPLPSQDKDPAGPAPAWTPQCSSTTHSNLSAFIRARLMETPSAAPPWALCHPADGPPAGRRGPCWSNSLGGGRQLGPHTAVSVSHVAAGGPGSGGHLGCPLGLLRPCLAGLPQKRPGPRQDLHGAFGNLLCSGRSQRGPPCLVPIVSEHLPVRGPCPPSWDVQSAALKAPTSFACSPEQRVFSLNDTCWEGSSRAPGLAPHSPLQARPTTGSWLWCSPRRHRTES